jgi:hypothetical protein
MGRLGAARRWAGRPRVRRGDGLMSVHIHPPTARRLGPARATGANDRLGDRGGHRSAWARVAEARPLGLNRQASGQAAGCGAHRSSYSAMTMSSVSMEQAGHLGSRWMRKVRNDCSSES